MNLKTIQWLVILALTGVTTYMFFSNDKLSSKITALETENEHLVQAKSARDEEATDLAREQAEEMKRLQKENSELLRLRNEIRQLREDKQNLNKQVQTVQAMAQNAQAQAQAAEAQAHAAQSVAANAVRVLPAFPQQSLLGSPTTMLTQEQLDARKKVGLTFDAATAQNACIVNLRFLDGAKQQWALQNKKPPGSFPTMADIAPLLRNQLPVCPTAGTYSINNLETPPSCTQPGHLLGR